MFSVSEEWKTAYPGAAVGVLALGNVTNPEHHPDLDQLKEALEGQIRTSFSSQEDLRAQPRLQAYRAYYKRFKKTYHVQMQMESIAFKGKSIPRVAALVEAMFIAELKDQLLTAGHDLDIVEPPVRLDIAKGTEQFVRINGQEQQLKAGDMFIADTQGVLSTVIYGPDRRTQIVPDTSRALFTVYAPPGIGEEAVFQHLKDIEANIRLFVPQAEAELLQVYGTN
ncbi:MAG TPA: phenylalanine--tRNA ligase beta subunit-related protein [Anaerolineae bacterium]|nr:phenylalanine--tRNA ligase beta subunit-related protein [Anaerolineae bacterium]